MEILGKIHIYILQCSGNHKTTGFMEILGKIYIYILQCSGNHKTTVFMEILGKIHIYCSAVETTKLQGSRTNQARYIYTAVQWKPQIYRVHGNIRRDTYLLQCSGNHKTTGFMEILGKIHIYILQCSGNHKTTGLMEILGKIHI